LVSFAMQPAEEYATMGTEKNVQVPASNETKVEKKGVLLQTSVTKERAEQKN